MVDSMDMEVRTGNNILSKAESYITEIFSRKEFENFSYHNLDHTLRVRETLDELAVDLDATEQESEILALSALFHDVGFVEGYDDHEDNSASIAEKFLQSHQYPEEKIKQVKECILATRMSAVPLNKLHMMIRDADTASLGMEGFFEITEELRKELNNVKGEKIDEKGWNYINYQFFQDHNYYTEAARERFGKTKRQNFKEVKKRLGLKKKKGKTPDLGRIGSNKSAQTQFKTALRNHIDLSAIADNKANTMLSVTSLIISLSLPILGTNLTESPHLLIPTIILLFVCVTAITFATLATRPISMAGRTTLEDINSMRSNLFFFGNFYKMNYDDYERGIHYIVSDSEKLDSAITRDLFYLGKALGKKYMYLRRCYNVFMYGIIIAVLSFAIAFALNANQASASPFG